MLEMFETVTYNKLLNMNFTGQKTLVSFPKLLSLLNYCSHDINGNRWSCPNEKH